MSISIKGNIIYGPKIITEGLVLYLDAANSKSYPNTGNTWYDLSKIKDDVALNASYGVSDNSSYMIFGTNDDISYVNSITTYGNNTTWCTWINRTSSINTYNMFMGRYLPYFAARDDGKFMFSNAINGSQVTIYSNGITIENDIWYNICFSTEFDNTNTRMKIYINGELNATSGYYLGSQTHQNHAFTIGNWQKTSSFYPFNGKISIVKVYNRTLSESEIMLNYNAVKSRFNL